MELLLGQADVDPNTQDNDGRTPHWCAVHNGHAGVVEILLRRSEADPNQPDNEGETPLWCAARNGYEGVVKILVARGDIDPNKSAYGQTLSHVLPTSGTWEW